MEFMTKAKGFFDMVLKILKGEIYFTLELRYESKTRNL